MSLLFENVGKDIENLIISIYNKYKDELNNNIQDRIGYLNIYHNKWDSNNESELLYKMSSLLNIDPNLVLTINFLMSKPDCKNQHYHIDYEGKTETFFIPLCELNDKNGTEIVEFKNLQDNIKYFPTLLEISNLCYSKSDLINELSKYNIDSTIYNIKYINSNPFSLIKIPNYLLHRGRTNETPTDRVMFSIVVSHNSNYSLTLDKVVSDAELDENMDIKINIINNRINNISI